MLLALAAVLLVPLLDTLVFDILSRTDSSLNHFVNLQLGFLLPLLLPLAVGVSVLRYRLWEVELLVSRALLYGLLTALIAGLYVLVVGGLGALLRVGDDVWLTILATGLIATLFNPVRQRLQRAVNRLLYGERDDPLAVLARLEKRLAAATAPDETLPTIVETIAQALKLPYVAAVVSQDGESHVVAFSGVEQPGALVGFPLMFQTEIIGELLVAPRGPGESFTPTERRLLENLARQAGAAVYAADLTERLQRSRERLVVAREEERRRLRHDLHDGLGPELASLSLKLDAARNLLRRNPEAADTLLVELKTQTQAAIADIRRLVYGLRPPALDQFGLVSALREYAASASQGDGLLISVEAPAALPALPAAVEVAAYRIAQEAITNAIRHAHARHCALRLDLRDGLSVEVRDDSCGLPAASAAGVGLTSMRERAAELGGTLTIEALPGGGTAVRAHLPCAVAE